MTGIWSVLDICLFPLSPPTFEIFGPRTAPGLEEVFDNICQMNE